jgi:hypothetical protein
MTTRTALSFSLLLAGWLAPIACAQPVPSPGSCYRLETNLLYRTGAGLSHCRMSLRH